MKNFGKLFMLSALALTLVSCGDSAGTPGPAAASTATTGISTQTFTTIEPLRSFYKNRSNSSGLSNGMTVYHVGAEYGANYSNNFSFDFDFDFCFNDCQSQQNNQLESIVNNGEYKVIKSVSGETVSYDEATGSDGNNFIFVNRTYSKQDSLFTEMLNLDGVTYSEVKVTAVTIRLSNNKTMQGNLIKYLSYGGYVNKAYVVSAELPNFANPVAILNSYGSYTGRLESFNNVKIVEITGIQ